MTDFFTFINPGTTRFFTFTILGMAHFFIFIIPGTKLNVQGDLIALAYKAEKALNSHK
jgi:hypothetical protein